MKAKMTTLQECIQDVHVRGDRENLHTDMVSFRAHIALKEATEKVLETHSISLSAYLRKCMENLVRDYRDTRTED
jgi:hypothetical protein